MYRIKFFTCSLLIFFSCSTQAQNGESFKIASDTINWQIPQLNLGNNLRFSEMDTFSVFNNDVAKGQKYSFLLSSGPSRMEFNSSDIQKQSYLIRIQKSGNNKTMNLVFWPDLSNAQFNDAYKAANVNKVVFELPEIYELCNIAMSLSIDEGDKSYPVTYGSDYYKEVVDKFGTFKTHPLIVTLKKGLNDNGDAGYASLCTDSYSYHFDKAGHIVSGKEYFQLGNRASIAENIALWESFAEASHFRNFYKLHQQYYDSVKNQAESFLSFKNSWSWMEKKYLPRINGYKFVLSPLISYDFKALNFNNNNYSEVVFFSPAFNKSSYKNLNEATSKLLYLNNSFIAAEKFYLNKISRSDSLAINQIFSDFETWAEVGREAFNMPDATALFKEYLSQAAYLLYVKETDPGNYKTVKYFRDRFMKQKGFKQFEAFSDKLFKKYESPDAGSGILQSLPGFLAELKQ